jgi:hypothetical protein
METTCTECQSEAEQLAMENWKDAHGRWPARTGLENDEIARDAAYLIEQGYVEHCS